MQAQVSGRFLQIIRTVPSRQILSNLIFLRNQNPCKAGNRCVFLNLIISSFFRVWSHICQMYSHVPVFALLNMNFGFFAGSKLTAAFPCQNFLGSWSKKMSSGKLFLFLFLTRCKKKENQKGEKRIVQNFL